MGSGLLCKGLETKNLPGAVIMEHGYAMIKVGSRKYRFTSSWKCDVAWQ